MEVDVVVLTRDQQPIREEVLQAINAQQDVLVQLHRVVGTPRPTDENRWSTIARARNVGKALGSTPWLMFVDDDVVLTDPTTIADLLAELKRKPGFAVLAADYLGDRNPSGTSVHVGMGATLFRREALADIEFRWAVRKCECQCMADDLRKRHRGIDYSETLTAEHLGDHDSSSHCESHAVTASEQVDSIVEEVSDLVESTESTESTESESTTSELAEGSEGQVGLTIQSDLVAEASSESGDAHQDGEILVAFDSRHKALFLHQFLGRLRYFENWYTVHGVAYGLRRKDQKAIRRLAGVNLHPQPASRNAVCRDRLLGFQSVLSELCPKTPVAYWDAGDVLFQASLEPLWDRVRASPDQLLVVEEPLEFEQNPGHQDWIGSIRNEQARRETYDLLTGQPVINGGFIAGRAGKLLEHFKVAEGLASGMLFGAGGGDQVILNYCRYRDPAKFTSIDDTWNYCLAGRSGRDCKVKRNRYLDVLNGRVVSVVHGNAGTLI